MRINCGNPGARREVYHFMSMYHITDLLFEYVSLYTHICEAVGKDPLAVAEEVLEGVAPDPGRDPEPHVVDLGALQLLVGEVAAVVRHALRPIRLAVETVRI